MTAYEPLSARLNAAFDGCYEAVASLYPGFDTEAFRDAVELESSLAA